MSQHVYSLALNSSVGGKFCTSVLHYLFEDSAFQTTAEAAKALANAWISACKTAWTNIHPTDSILMSAKARCVNAAGGFEAVVLITSANVGTRPGTTSVAGLSPVIISYEQLNGPRRGRLFMHGVSETDAQDGILSGGFKSSVGTNLSTLFQNLVLTGGGAPTAVNVIYDREARIGRLIDFRGLSDLLGTQRRRQLPA